jgi:ribonuclease HII
MPVRRKLRSFDLKQIQGLDNLIGVDEAGRGSLAGPVVAGAVLVTRDFLEGRWALTKSSRVNDSKQLSPQEREEIYAELDELMRQGALQACVGSASASEIEELNILGATKLAMRRALEQLYPPESFYRQEEPDLFSSPEAWSGYHPTVNSRILIDGLRLKGFPYPHTPLVKGDGRSLCIAMASIVAKVTRDHMMNDLDLKYPGYGFAQHKGYGTEEHRTAILAKGRCPEHREVFLRKLMAKREDPAQMNWLTED